MLLKNFQASFAASNYSYAKTMGGTSTNVYTGNLAYNNQNVHYGGNYSGGPHVVIGAGDTPPTVDDYDLADASIMASDKMASLTQVASWTRADGTAVTVQWVNNSNAPITVKEMGLAVKVGNASYSKTTNVLMARKVLDTPITIQPGETYAFTYGLKV